MTPKLFCYTPFKHKNYKYILTKMYVIFTNIKPFYDIYGDFYHLDIDGKLTIYKGYAWDGASGPAIDTKSTMRASCVHDVFYQMMQLNQIPMECKDKADRELERIMIEDSGKDLVNIFRAKYYYTAVKLFGWIALKYKK